MSTVTPAGGARLSVLTVAWLLGHMILASLTSVAASSAGTMLLLGALGYGPTFGVLQALILRPGTHSARSLGRGWLLPSIVVPAVGGLIAAACATALVLLLSLVSAELASDALDTVILTPAAGAGLGLGVVQRRLLGGAVRRHGVAVGFLLAHTLAPPILLTSHRWLPFLLFSSPAGSLGPMAILVFVTVAGAAIGGLAAALLLGAATLCLLAARGAAAPA
ncbi:MAG: hypothetical protein IT306_12020 [Chloroflexi bacterium]|nr:hypothetical protein [Chloroflexota bacterium]